MRIEDFQIVGEVRPKGYTNEMILTDIRSLSIDIEKRFGVAVAEWSLGGVIFDSKENQPCLFYPCSRLGVEMIMLAGPSLKSIDFARFQIAHEIVHCLNPSGGQLANVLEEGMAAWYQQCYATKELKGRVRLGDEKYIAARKLFNKFLKKSKINNPIIKLRGIEPYLYKVSHETFAAAGVLLPTSLEEVLLTKFEDFHV